MFLPLFLSNSQRPSLSLSRVRTIDSQNDVGDTYNTDSRLMLMAMICSRPSKSGPRTYLAHRVTYRLASGKIHGDLHVTCFEEIAGSIVFTVDGVNSWGFKLQCWKNVQHDHVVSELNKFFALCNLTLFKLVFLGYLWWSSTVPSW